MVISQKQNIYKYINKINHARLLIKSRGSCFNYNTIRIYTGKKILRVNISSKILFIFYIFSIEMFKGSVICFVTRVPLYT